MSGHSSVDGYDIGLEGSGFEAGGLLTIKRMSGGWVAHTCARSNVGDLIEAADLDRIASASRVDHDAATSVAVLVHHQLREPEANAARRKDGLAEPIGAGQVASHMSNARSSIAWCRTLAIYLEAIQLSISCGRCNVRSIWRVKRGCIESFVDDGRDA